MSVPTAIASCTATGCAYNAGGCTALAITVAGTEKARCTTFIALDARGGLPNANGTVGACQRLECVHNEDLLCTAQAVDITDSAACAMYEAR